MKLSILGLALLAGTAIAAPATASVNQGLIINEYSLTNIGHVSVGSGVYDKDAQTSGNAHLTSTGTQTASVNKSKNKGINGTTYTAGTDNNAKSVIVSANEGTITFTSDASTKAPQTGASDFWADNSASFIYDFNTTSATTLGVKYDIQGTVYGDGNVINLLDGKTGTVLGSFDYRGAPQKGSVGFDLLSNTNYKLQILGSDKVAGTQSIAAHTSVFTFGLTSAVPEPASWALMIGGVAVAGGSLRTRRRVALTA